MYTDVTQMTKKTVRYNTKYQKDLVVKWPLEITQEGAREHNKNLCIIVGSFREGFDLRERKA